VHGALLASIFNVAASIGLPAMCLLVVLETGCGIPFSPGDLAVITAGIAAGDHKLNIVAVVSLAAAAAIVGDNIGYVIGRHGGRRLLERPGRFYNQRKSALEIGERFFDRFGAKTVFFGRWLPVMRVFTSWMAGGAEMPWPTFLIWNTAGGIAWATTLALGGYLAGATAKAVLNDFTDYGIYVVPVLIVAALILLRRRRRRTAEAKADGAVVASDELAAGSDVGERPGVAPAEPPAL
jgi:membrane protein DedA with SNARE-associated domain